MRITTLRLHDFRSYGQLILRPPEGVTVLVGKNGAGKTNLLEAVHLTCLGRSHRTSQDKDMIREGMPTGGVELTVQTRLGEDKVGVRLYAESGKRKTYFVNGKTAQKAADIMGQAACVIFSPEDLQLIKGGPDGRRRFLDMLLSQRQKAYFTALQKYHSALKHRNALLKTGDLRSLDAWDEALCGTAAVIARHRADVVQRMNALAAGHYQYISGREEETLCLRYISTLCDTADPGTTMREGLKKTREDDIRRQTTTFGPHRDDISVTLSQKDARAFASQGQARTAALSLKLSAYDLLEESFEESPLLLLDDVLSELDAERRRKLLARIADAQTLLTCTDLSDLTGASPACILHVERDGLTQIRPE